MERAPSEDGTQPNRGGPSDSAGAVAFDQGYHEEIEADLEVTDEVEDSDLETLLEGLNDANTSAPPRDRRELGVFVRKDGELIAGAYGESVWDWVHLKYLWVDSRYARNGLGRQIMAAVEDHCRRRGCVGVHLDTYSFQALAFYEKCGYTLFGSISDHPRGGVRYYLKKEIAANGR